MYACITVNIIHVARYLHTYVHIRNFKVTLAANMALESVVNLVIFNYCCCCKLISKNVIRANESYKIICKCRKT